MNIYVNEKKIYVKMARNYLKVSEFFSGLHTCQHVSMVKCRMYVWQNKVDQNNVAPQDVLNKLLLIIHYYVMIAYINMYFLG